MMKPRLFKGGDGWYVVTSPPLKMPGSGARIFVPDGRGASVGEAWADYVRNLPRSYAWLPAVLSRLCRF